MWNLWGIDVKLMWLWCLDSFCLKKKSLFIIKSKLEIYLNRYAEYFCNITYIYIYMYDNEVLNEKNSLSEWNRRIERMNNFKRSNFEGLHTTFCGDFYRRWFSNNSASNYYPWRNVVEFNKNRKRIWKIVLWKATLAKLCRWKQVF